MSVEWHRLGEYIEQCDERNADGRYGVGSVRGICINKMVIETKADMTKVPLGSYKLFRPEEFCYVTVTSRNGEKVSLAENETAETFIEASCISVGLFDPDFGVKRCEHGARSAECLQRAA